MQENIKQVIVKNTVRKEFKTVPIFQWDTGHVLVFEGFDLPEAFQVHFAFSESGESVPQIGSNDQVTVPDALVEDGRMIYAWLYISTEDAGLTKFVILMPVNRRAKPTHQVPPPVEHSEIEQAIVVLNAAVARTETAAENAEQSEGNASQYAENAYNSSEAAASAAESAEGDARTATEKAQIAVNAAETATRKAQEALESAQLASQKASEASGYADGLAEAVRTANEAKQTAVNKATEATQSASNAAQNAQEALSSAQAAEGSANDADTAKRGAETAMGAAQGYAGNASIAAQAAESAKDTAVQKAGEAGQSATNAAQSAQAAAQTAAQFEEDITELKSALNTLAIPVINQAIPWAQGWIRNDGSDGDATNICRTVGMFALPANAKVTAKEGFKVQLCEYSVFGDLTSFVKKINANYESGTNVFATSADKFYRFTVKNTEESRIYYYDLLNDTVTWEGEPLYTDTTLTLSEKAADAKETGDRLAIIDNRFQIINLFDKDSEGCLTGYYLNTANGQPTVLASCTVSDFIDISAYASVKAVNTHIICFYDSDKGFVSCPPSMDSRAETLTIAIPSGVKYLRFSTFNTVLGSAQIGKNVTRDAYYAYGKYTMPDLVIGTPSEEAQIIVDASGGGDYTSFTEAVYNNIDTGEDMVIKAGTYDIAAEYVALFGADVVANLADSTDLGGFQFGVILRNRKFIFETGSRLVCDWTGHTVDGSHRFSPIRVDYNVEIIGMNLECQHTFYAIHDDYGLLTTPYTVKYKNCVVNAENLRQQNVIGGGTKKYSRHIIEGCYFNNGTNSNIHTARYHNTNQADAVPEIFISNTFFNGTFTARWYGTQTTKMKVYVSGCKARAIYTMQEATGYEEENVELYKWCCEETNPVT